MGDDFVEASHVLNLEIASYIYSINIKILFIVVGAFGAISNVVNMIVIRKMGLKDTVNVSLMGLALADFLGLVILVWIGLCYHESFNNLEGIPFIPSQVVYVTGGWPRIGLTQVTSWITVFVTLERCLCITVPLKVKRIMTPKVATISVVAIFVCGMALTAPVYSVTSLGPVFLENENRTAIGLVFAHNREEIDSFGFTFTGGFRIISFVIDVTLVIILIISLQKKQQWRKSVTSISHPVSSKLEGASNEVPTKKQSSGAKDKNVGKMVAVVSTIFVICFIINTANLLAMAAVKEYNKGGEYGDNLFLLFWSCGHVAEGINSSVNTLIYYRMSSKFRSTFRATFGQFYRSAKAK